MYDHDDDSPINPWGDKDAPQPALGKPAWYAPGAVVRTDVKVKVDHLTRTSARQYTPAETPVTPTARERAAGIYLECRRTRGGTAYYRAVRTEAMGDEPLPDVPYRKSAVTR